MGAEENRVQRFLRRCMCAVCTMMFGFFLLVFFLSDQGPVIYRALISVALMLLVMGTGWLSRKFQPFLAKHFTHLAFGVALVFFLVAVWFAAMLRFDPVYDMEAIFRGGEGWGIYGDLMRFTSHTFDPNYFYR